MSEQVIDAEVVEENGEARPAEPAAVVPTGPTPALAVTPQVKAAELGERLTVIKEAMDNAMERDVDYGKVPGTDKPTLFKPGAEKLSVLFQLDVQLVNEKSWGPGEHLTVVSHATVFHAPTGSRLGYGEGVCTTREKKYAKRKADLKCPDCRAETVKRSKKAEEFYCWAKIGGCGSKFSLNDERITGQDIGEVDNPDLPDLWNTVVKMAEKRARVDAVLAVTGASALFTQDVEDMQPSDRGSAAQGASAEQPKAAAGFASDKQRSFCERLLRDAGCDDDEVASICDYMRSKLLRADISKTIDALKEEDKCDAVLDELKERAAKFAETLADVANGAPSPADPNAEAHSEDIPF